MVFQLKETKEGNKGKGKKNIKNMNYSRAWHHVSGIPLKERKEQEKKGIDYDLYFQNPYHNSFHLHH